MSSSPGGVTGNQSGLPVSLKSPAHVFIVLAQLAVIAASIVALWFWVPDTIDSWNEQRASDFPNFNGAALLTREGLGDRLYDRSPERDDELQQFCEVPRQILEEQLTFVGPGDACRALSGNFRSPPSLILFYLPGSFLSPDDAYHATFVVLAIASIALAAWAASTFQSWPARVAVFLAILAMPILQLALRLSQPSAIYALALLAGVAFDSRRMSAPAGICFALLSLKPQFLLLPLIYLAFRGSTRTVAWTVGISASLFLAGLLAIGPATLASYVQLNIDLLRDGPHPLQQAWMYNWQGFALALTGEPQRTAAALLSVATLLLLAVAWLRNRQTSWALTVAAGVLAVPYVLFYDWVMLASAAALASLLLAAERARQWLGAAMLLVWGGIWLTHQSLPFFGTRSGSLPEGEVYWSTLSLALAMVVTAIVVERFSPRTEPQREPILAGSD
jgi:hypothetical protein